MAAAPSWCPVSGGSDLILPAGACLNNEVRSQDQRQEAKKGEKRREKKNILKCEPWRKTRKTKRKYNVAEIITVLEKKNSRVRVVHELPARSVVVTD